MTRDTEKGRHREGQRDRRKGKHGLMTGAVGTEHVGGRG